MWHRGPDKEGHQIETWVKEGLLKEVRGAMVGWVGVRVHAEAQQCKGRMQGEHGEFMKQRGFASVEKSLEKGLGR